MQNIHDETSLLSRDAYEVTRKAGTKLVQREDIPKDS